MSDFTTWTAFKTAVLNDLNNRVPGIKSYRTPDGTFVEARTPEEVFKLIGEIEARIESDSATSGVPSRRVHTAIQGDSW